MVSPTSAHPNPTSHLKYRPDIDGLRAFAVLAVVIFHAFPAWLKGGFIGVDVFFVISGYLISTIIFEKLDQGAFNFLHFYSRRIIRIFPALIFVCAACALFGWFALFASEYAALGKHIAAGAGFVANLVFWSEAGYFDNSAETKVLLHLWSLGIEEQFYIIWPLMLWLARKCKFNLLMITTCAALVSFALNLTEVKYDAVATFYSPQTRAWELLAGSILAWFNLNKKNIVARLENNKIRDVLSLLGLLLLLVGAWQMNKALNFPGGWALLPVLGTVLLIASGDQALINRVLLSNNVIVWFGRISFPLYLWHWPLLSFARIVESETPSRDIRLAAVAVSVVFAYLTYEWIERPMRLSKSGTLKVTLLLVFMLLMGGVGYNIYLQDGYPLRNTFTGSVITKELISTSFTDDECSTYIDIKNPLFPYCKFTNAQSTETVAVIGDSHAYAAYPGISEFLKQKGINSVLLANSGCPPFTGMAIGKSEFEKDACRLRIEQLLATIIKQGDIKKVLIFTRGPYYNTATAPLTGNQDIPDGAKVPISDFVKSVQITIDTLVANGKIVFYVSENPELYYPIEACYSRPFKLKVRECSADRSKVLQRQGDYLEAFSALKNATFINALSAFCPETKCVIFDADGALLYADDNHLSLVGSRFQANHLLRPYLE